MKKESGNILRVTIGSILMGLSLNILLVDAASGLSQAEKYYNLGCGYQDKSDYDNAIYYYNKAIELNPRLAEAYYNRGNAYTNKGLYDQAISDFTKALEINPRDAKAYYNRGNAYDKKGDSDQAIANYTKALEINPRDAEAYNRLTETYNNRGNAYKNKGNYDQAIADYTEAIKLNPKEADYYSCRADCFMEKKDYKRALEDITKAIEISPEDGGFRWTQTKIYLLQGDTKNAGKCCEKLLELVLKDIEKEPSADNYSNASVCALFIPNFPDAEKYASKGLEIDPSYELLHANLGHSCLFQGKRSEALAEYKRFIANYKNNPKDVLKDDFSLLKKRYPDKTSLIDGVEKELGIGK
ncbi:MAG: tetratricopeptide repeat protein [bacterium]